MLIMKRDSEGHAEQVGTIERQGDEVVFDLPEDIAQWLSSFTFQGQQYDTTSPDYFEVLPYYLSGDRLWAVPE